MIDVKAEKKMAVDETEESNNRADEQLRYGLSAETSARDGVRDEHRSIDGGQGEEIIGNVC